MIHDFLRRYAAAFRRPWVMIPTVLVFLMVIGVFAPMPAAADPDGDLTPQGIGDLFTTASLQGDDNPTLYEAFPVSSYAFWSELASGKWFETAFNGLANVIMFLLVAVVRGAIVLVWTMFSFTNTTPMTEAISGAIGGAATELLAWLLPSALAIGGLVAYFLHQRATGGVISQIAWVAVGGLLAVSFATSSEAWVGAVDKTRIIGSEAIMGATGDALATTDTPFQYPAEGEPGPAFNGDPTNTALRKSADSIWRSYVVTPWCIGQFGSTNACERYGEGFLQAGTSKDDRKDWMEDIVRDRDGNGTHAEPHDYIWGYSPADRVGIALVALVIGCIFAFLIISLAFAALFAFVSALFALWCGVFFTMGWGIPGKPREWGMNWLNVLVGLTLQSMFAALILSGTLILTSAAFALTSSLGWGAAAGMAIIVAIAAFKFRSTLGQIVNVMTPGGGMTTMLGYMALRGAGNLLGRAGGLAGRGARGLARGAGKAGAWGARKTGAGARRASENTWRRVRNYRRLPAHTQSRYPAGGDHLTSPVPRREPLQIDAPRTPNGTRNRPRQLGAPARGRRQIEAPSSGVLRRESGDVSLGSRPATASPRIHKNFGAHPRVIEHKPTTKAPSRSPRPATRRETLPPPKPITRYATATAARVDPSRPVRQRPRGQLLSSGTAPGTVIRYAPGGKK